MYIPSYYKEGDAEKLIEFMVAHNFALLISSTENIPTATHLPFIIEKREDKIYLVSHMARANPQWKTFDKNDVLTVFQGPHGYVSPSHYEKKQNVPTWNYIAVHAYGKVRLISDPKDVFSLMERTITNFEKEFLMQWKELSDEYVNSMLKAIVAFEIEVTKLDGKFKLSQNKTKNEQQNIISTFEKSEDSTKQELAEKMKKKL